jgi:multidrug efflux system membrane fusion protein
MALARTCRPPPADRLLCASEPPFTARQLRYSSPHVGFRAALAAHRVRTMPTDSFDHGLRRARLQRRRVIVILFTVAASIAALSYFLARGGSATAPGAGRLAGRNSPIMPVATAPVEKGDIAVYLFALGTATPRRNVTVSAQVAGQLLRVDFREGQSVRAGEVLAEIDARPYQAALTTAEGALARDRALLANARIDLARYQTLFAQDSISQQQLDGQRSLVQQYEGVVKADEGQIATAKVNLGYTKIRAPISGRVGLRQVDPGNNVQNGSAIVVITQLQPIDVLFTIAEDDVASLRRRMQAGPPLPVEAFDRARHNRLASGTLISLDNQIDTSTGTIKAKAEFANSDENLFPNQFVNVRVLLDVVHDTLVIPASALEHGSDGLFVYVVNADHTVSQRKIETGPSEAERVAVTHGLAVGELVVTEGADRLRDGARVEPLGAASGTRSANPPETHRSRSGPDTSHGSSKAD